MGFFSDDEDEDIAILDVLFDDEKKEIKKGNYNDQDFDDECEDEDDYYSKDDE